VHIPILTISFLTPAINFNDYDGIILTSKQSIIALQYYRFSWNKLQCVCVSEPTAEAAREAGAVDVKVGDGYGTSIPNLLKSYKRNGKWLYLRPKVIASDWVERAREDGFSIDEAIVYETICNDGANHTEVEADGVLIFTSPSSVRCFTEKYPILPTHDVVAIGTTTQNALPSGIASHLSHETNVKAAVDLGRQIALLH
jgi:uroporphyrinogen-III synthase